MWILPITILLITKCGAYNILYVAPFPSGSHGILGDSLVNILLNAGHEVTYISAMTKMSSNPKVKIIDVSSNKKIFPENFLNIKAIMDGVTNMKQDDFFFPIMDNISLATLQNYEVQELLNNEKLHYDVVIAEWMYNELYAGIATVFDCPLIWFSTLEAHWMILKAVDETPNPAYSPDRMSSEVIPFTFSQRVKELWVQISRGFFREFWMYKNIVKIYYDMYAPVLTKRRRPVPSYEDIRYNGSLILGNSHAVMGQATRLPQNYKSVGGFHIEKEPKPLPENLQRIIDEAKHGVIYFSMGSNLKSVDYPPEIKKDLLAMFGRLQQTVLWKFEDNLDDVPSNVHILKWAPQQSILAHPNCVIFITHCGLLSTTEAIHFGVPIIGIPAFVDQFVNAARAVRKGFGKKVNLGYSLIEELKAAIDDITSTPRYREKAKELSRIYHDRPITPQQEVVYSVEHVIRTKGATYLRSPALCVPWYQKMYLDLLSLIVISILSVVFIIKRIFCYLDNSKTKID